MKKYKIQNNMMGFTLAELLAVLIVLAIIALIIFPVIDDFIDDSRKDTFLQSVNGLKRGAEIDYQGDDYKGDRTYEYKNGKFTLVDVKGNLKDENIKVDGLIEDGVGEVYVDEEGEISLTVYNKKYCATKGVDDQKIKIEDKTSDNCNVSSCSRYLVLGKSIRSCDIQAIDPDSNPRYVGQDPNNYVKFNNELWRIIGMFDGQAKIIKDGYYSEVIPWDKNYKSDWVTASLQLLLNNDVDGYITTIRVNDLTNYNYIDLNHEWNIGAVANGGYRTREELYSIERGDTLSSGMTTHLWTGAIGLMYPSDYGYSTSGDYEICSSVVWNSWVNDGIEYEECAQKSWLLDGLDSWTITATTLNQRVFFVSNGGAVIGYEAWGNISSYGGRIASARPVVYLNSNVVIKGGKGTNTDPYILGI